MTALDLVICGLWLCILISGINLYVILKIKPSKPQGYLIGMCLCVFFLSAAYLLEMTSVNAESAENAIRFEYLSGDLSLIFYLMFVLEWRKIKLPRSAKIGIVCFALGTVTLTLPGALSEYYFSVTGFITDGAVPESVIEYGVGNDVIQLIQLLLFILCIVIIAMGIRRASSARERRILCVLMAGAAVPFIMSLLFSLGVFGFYDPLSFGYLISQLLLSYCIMHEHVLDLLQNAFENAVMQMDDAMIIRDEEKHVIYLNEKAHTLFPEIQNGAEISGAALDYLSENEFELNSKYYQNKTNEVLYDGKLCGFTTAATDVSNIYHLKQLLEAENKRITADLELAAAIQRNALPRDFPKRRSFDIYASMRPAKEVGGDFYDFFLTDSTHIGAVIADVSGKGVPAALFMMTAKSYIKDYMMSGMEPNDALTQANKQLCEGNDAEMFVTVWAVKINLQTGETVFANAGHNPPALRRTDGSWELIKSKPNLVLADMAEITYRSHPLSLNASEVLFLYTDGVVEAQNDAQELYGDARMLSALSRGGASPRELIAAVQSDVDEFVSGAPQFDDITMLALRINDFVRKLTVKAALSSCGEVSAFIQKWLGDYDCLKKTAREIMLAQDEIFSNIARYAYDGGEEGTATVELFFEGDSAVLRFTDMGVPFNPLDVTRAKRTYEDDWEIGGDGIHLVKSVMDECVYEYKDNSNIFIMKKSVGWEK